MPTPSLFALIQDDAVMDGTNSCRYTREDVQALAGRLVEPPQLDRVLAEIVRLRPARPRVSSGHGSVSACVFSAATVSELRAARIELA